MSRQRMIRKIYHDGTGKLIRTSFGNGLIYFIEDYSDFSEVCIGVEEPSQYPCFYNTQTKTYVFPSRSVEDMYSFGTALAQRLENT